MPAAALRYVPLCVTGFVMTLSVMTAVCSSIRADDAHELTSSQEVSDKDESTETDNVKDDEQNRNSDQEGQFNGVFEAELLAEEGDWGGVVGQILWEGETPKRNVIVPRGSPPFTTVKPLLDDSLIVGPHSRGIANSLSI